MRAAGGVSIDTVQPVGGVTLRLRLICHYSVIMYYRVHQSALFKEGIAHDLPSRCAAVIMEPHIVSGATGHAAPDVHLAVRASPTAVSRVGAETATWSATVGVVRRPKRRRSWGDGSPMIPYADDVGSTIRNCAGPIRGGLTTVHSSMMGMAAFVHDF